MCTLIVRLDGPRECFFGFPLQNHRESRDLEEAYRFQDICRFRHQLHVCRKLVISIALVGRDRPRTHRGRESGVRYQIPKERRLSAGRVFEFL